MKQFIIMIAMVSLGLVLYSLLMGPQPDSMFEVTKKLWAYEIIQNQRYP